MFEWENAKDLSRYKGMKSEEVGFWDPMGFCQDVDVADFKRRRGSELMHGFVAMYAAMGLITPEYFKFRATSPRLLASSSRTCRTALPRSARCRWRAGCSGSRSAVSTRS